MIKSEKISGVIVFIIIALIVSLVIGNGVYANDLETILQIVQASSEEKDLPNDQRYIL